MGWQKATGNLVATTSGRYTSLIGPRLRACAWFTDQRAAAIAVEAANRMIRIGEPISVRAA